MAVTRRPPAGEDHRYKVCWSASQAERTSLEAVVVHVDVGPRTLCGRHITVFWDRGTTFSRQYRVSCLDCRRMLGYQRNLEDM